MVVVVKAKVKEINKAKAVLKEVLKVKEVNLEAVDKVVPNLTKEINKVKAVVVVSNKEIKEMVLQRFPLIL